MGRKLIGVLAALSTVAVVTPAAAARPGVVSVHPGTMAGVMTQGRAGTRTGAGQQLFGAGAAAAFLVVAGGALVAFGISRAVKSDNPSSR